MDIVSSDPRPRFRVEYLRPGQHVQSLIGDYDDRQQAHDAATVAKQQLELGRFTITPGREIPWVEQPENRRHPCGHHFLASGEPEEI